MGFVSYNRVYLQRKLDEYESAYGNSAPEFTVHEAKVLLKMLEDIRDEGYNYAYNVFFSEFDCINRLKAFIIRNNDIPFTMENISQRRDIHYSDKQQELSEYLSVLEERMRSTGPVLSETPELFFDILKYTKRIFDAVHPDTAYVFLLRDTLLPYLAFKFWDSGGRFAAYPFLIGRKYLSFFRSRSAGDSEALDPNGDNEGLYDSIHDAIFSALLSEPESFEDFRTNVKDLLIKKLCEYPEALMAFLNLLKAIPEKKILIIESGYIGSVPMLLSCFDERVDFRLFTTVPYFYKPYKDKYYTHAFEKIRLFETVQCQDALFRLSSLNGNRFLILETDSDTIKDHATMELRAWHRLISQV